MDGSQENYGTPSEPDIKAKKPKIKLPKGYDDEHAFLTEMIKLYSDDVLADKMNRDAAIEDIAFLSGDQWPADVRAKREAARKPIMTINRLPAFVAQVLGSRKLNETEAKVSANTGGSKQEALVRAELIRSIQKQSRAETAYDNALAGAVICGIGNFEIELDYDNLDAFDQSICVNPLSDHLAVVWDHLHLSDPTGRNAEHCFVPESMSKSAFYRKYPWATPSDIVVDTSFSAQLWGGGWFQQDSVRVVAYWSMRSKKRTVALMTNGDTVDITDLGPEALTNVVQRQDGTPIMREIERPYAQKYICSGTDVLEGPYDLPIDRLPIFRVPGWEIKVGDLWQRWGLLRFLKDPQRLHNYWRSVVAERLTQTPKNVWLASDAAVAGREKEFRDSHMSDDPLLVYNSEAGNKPERQVPAQMEPAFMAQAEITSQDLKDVSNIHEANLGMPSNEVSGVAISARQRVSDTGTILYHTNLAAAIEEGARVMNMLIPVVYDTPRIVKVMGVDAKDKMQIINDLGNPDSIDITGGRFDVTVHTGPSYATKRYESAENMLKLANAMPQVLGVSADLIVEAQDWPNAQKIADRLRMAMPAQYLTEDEMTPQIKAAQEKAQQMQTAQQQLDLQQSAADLQNTQAQAGLNVARAQNYQVQASLLPAAAQNTALKTAATTASLEMASHVAAMKVGT